MTQIILYGKGGQGVKLLGKTLAHIVAQKGKEVTLTYEYDSNVRGGSVVAYLVFSDTKIENPLIEEADYLIALSDSKELKGKIKVVDEDVIEPKSVDIIVPFTKIAKDLGNLKMVNMITLGYLLKQLKIKIKNLDMSKILPKAMFEENVKAISQGYEFGEQ